MLNYIDDRIYTLRPDTGQIVGYINAPSNGDVTRGLGLDGTYLWCGEWDYSGTQGGALLRQISTTKVAVSANR